MPSNPKEFTGFHDNQRKTPEQSFAIDLSTRILKMPLASEVREKSEPQGETLDSQVEAMQLHIISHPEMVHNLQFLKILKANERGLDEDIADQKTGKKELDPVLLKRRQFFYNEYVEPVLNVSKLFADEKLANKGKIKKALESEFGLGEEPNDATF